MEQQQLLPVIWASSLFWGIAISAIVCCHTSLKKRGREEEGSSFEPASKQPRLDEASSSNEELVHLPSLENETDIVHQEEPAPEAPLLGVPEAPFPEQQAPPFDFDLLDLGDILNLPSPTFQDDTDLPYDLLCEEIYENLVSIIQGLSLDLIPCPTASISDIIQFTLLDDVEMEALQAIHEDFLFSGPYSIYFQDFLLTYAKEGKKNEKPINREHITKEYSTGIRDPLPRIGDKKRVGRLNYDMACFWEVDLGSKLSVPGIKRSSSQRRQRGPLQKWGGEGRVGKRASFVFDFYNGGKRLTQFKARCDGDEVARRTKKQTHLRCKQKRGTFSKKSPIQSTNKGYFA